MKLADIIIIIISSIMFLLSFGINSFISNIDYDRLEINIYSNNKLYYTNILDSTLDKIVEIDNELGYDKIVIKSGQVYVEKSDCPKQIIVEDGIIEKAGQVLVCVPNKVYIEILGKVNNDYDVLSF